MFGNLISSALRITTLPLDAVNAGLDIVSGGAGDKESRLEIPLTGDLERLRDVVADTAEEIDR